ncbi:MAG: hypothetical protein JJD95_19350 [Clostridium sp.]|nr:hypothetical protein [Clostridium sp.]
MKIWGIITVLVVIVAVVAIGVIAYKTGEKPKNDILTLKTIVKTFENQGVVLKEDGSKSPDEYEINGVNPVIFNIGEKKGTLLVYTFKSFVEREDIVNEGNKQFDFMAYPFNSKNAYLVYIASQNPETEAGMKSIHETYVSISDIVFKQLNDGKEIIYSGESTNWEGTFNLKYYEHWWEDETGKLRYESYHDSSPLIKYKMPDITSVGTVNFEYETTAGGGSITGVKPNKEGYLEVGRSGGSGAIPSENEEVTFKVNWNGKEETIILKVK